MNIKHPSKVIAECIEPPLSGEWGEDAEPGDVNAVRVIRTTNFTNIGKIDYSAGIVWRKVPEKVARQKKLIPGDIIIEKSGGSPTQPVGRVVFFENAEGPFLCNNFTAVIRSRNNGQIFSRYLFYALFFKHKYGQTLRFQNKTTGIINLQLAKYIAFEHVPLPPIETQRKIAIILDKAQELIDLRKAQMEKMDEFLRSVFLDMFGDPVTNPKGWEVSPLGDIGDWKSGGTPSRTISDFFQGDISWYSSGELESMYIGESIEHITQVSIEQSAAKIIEIGSLLLGMYDTAALKSSITTRSCSCNQAIAYAKLDPQICDVVFAYFTIQVAREYYRRMQRGVRQKNMNLSMIKSLEIPLPPLHLQTQFAAIVEATEAQKALMQQSLTEMENNFNSLMQRAFRGELF